MVILQPDSDKQRNTKRMKPALHFYDMAPGVAAFSTTRHGGYSMGNYGEFNINRYCGDSPESVSHNREALCQLLSIGDDRLIMPHQTHGTRIARIGEAFLSLSSKERLQALEATDALMTDLPHVCIGVSTADCIPLLLYDPEHHAICAIHAGWRGTVARIAQQAVTAMQESYATCPLQLLAQIGPGISLTSFEVGQEVYDAFTQADFPMSAIARRYPASDNPQAEKWHIDLPACNRIQLLDAGLSPASIAPSPVCTYQHPDTFFSARRLGILSGRIFTGIMCQTPAACSNP